MDRKEFLEKLERLLWDISEQERKEALEFYESYFDDAGKENETVVIQELGSPQKVADSIKADLKGNGSEYGEYRETGYTDRRFEEKNIPDIKVEPFAQKSKRSALSWILILLLFVIMLPFIGMGFGLVVSIIMVPVGITAALFFGCIVLVLIGIVFLGVAVSQFSTFSTVVFIAGIGLLMIGLGLLFLLGFLWLVVKVFPICFRCVINFVQKILYKGREGGGRK